MPPFSRFNPWVGASDPDEFDPRSVRKLAIGDMLGTMGNSLVQGASTGSWGDLAQGINAAFAGGSKALENRYLQEEDKFRARRKDDIDFRQEQEQLARQGRDREEFDRLKLARQRKLEVSTPAIERVANEISEEIKSKAGKDIPEGTASQLLSRISLLRDRVMAGGDEDSVVEAMDGLKEIGQMIGKPDLDRLAKKRFMEISAVESGNVQIGPDGNVLLDETGFPLPDLESYAEELVDKDADERIERKLALKYRKATIDNIYADNARSDENKDKPPTPAEINKEYLSLVKALSTLKSGAIIPQSDGDIKGVYAEGEPAFKLSPGIVEGGLEAAMLLNLGAGERNLSREEVATLNSYINDPAKLRQLAIDRATATRRQGIPPSLFGEGDATVDNVASPDGAPQGDDGDLPSEEEFRVSVSSYGLEKTKAMLRQLGLSDVEIMSRYGQ